MKVRRSTILVMTAIVAAVLGLGFMPSFASLGDAAPVCVTVDQTIAPGVTAKSWVLISPPLRSDDADHRVRVVTYGLQVSAGAGDRSDYMATPTVETSSREASLSPTFSDIQRQPDGKRRFISTRVEFSTRSNKTWADVRSSDDIDVHIVRETQVR